MIFRIVSPKFLALFVSLLSPPLLFAADAKADKFRVPIEFFAVPRNTPQISNPDGFQLVSDPDTKINNILIQTPFPEDPLLTDLLASLRKDVKVVCIVKNESYAHDLWNNLLRAKIKNLPNRLRFIVTTKSPRISRWGRDPYIVLANPNTRQFMLVSSFIKGSKRAEKWDDRFIRNAIVGSDFGTPDLINGEIDKIPSWLVEGGSISSDRKFFFMGKGSLLVLTEDEAGNTVATEQEALESIEKVTRKKGVILPAADLHSDRFHIPVGKTKFGEHTSLLSDPVKALEIIASMTEKEKTAALKKIQEYGLKWSDEHFIGTQEGMNVMARFLAKLNEDSLEKFLNVTQDEIEKVRQSMNTARRDQAAEVLAGQGVAVVRIPVLNKQYLVKNIEGEGEDEIEKFSTVEFPLTLSYTNIIQDCDGRTKTAYIPKYGIKKLDDYALNVYKSLGRFDRVIQVRSVQEAVGDGGPRCRVQVLGYPSSD